MNWHKTDTTLAKEFEFQDFRSALDFVGRVGTIAEAAGHHPDITLHDYRYVRITITTHDTGSLSEKDYILAESIDTLMR